MSELIERVCSWMVAIANDNSHGYSQDSKKRWLSPDIDCSSFVILAWESQGIPVKSKYNASFTGDMKDAFIKAGFQCIKYSKDLPLLRGDVLLNEQHHVVLYLGNNQIVHASYSETGGKYGREGDQTGGEVCVRSLYTPKYGWDYVLRYPDSLVAKNPYPVPTRTIAKGMSGDDCRWVQYELNEAGANLQIDGQIGSKSDEAIRTFQKVVGIQTDGRVGKITRQKLIDITNKVLDILVPVTNPYPIPTRVLKLNCKGEDVKFVQFALNQKINAGLQIDGSYGKLTRQKVIEFQKKVFPNQPTEWDGIVGKKTRERLES